MPFCEPCNRFYTPSTLTPDGDCPEGHHVAEPEDAPKLVQSDVQLEDEKEPKIPWHFWLLIIAVSMYLGWRLIQGIGWLIQRF